MHCRVFGSILGLHPTDVSSPPTFPPHPGGQNASRYFCQLSPGRQNHPLRISGVGVEGREGWGVKSVPHTKRKCKIGALFRELIEVSRDRKNR